MTNTISTKVASTVPIHCDDKKVRYNIDRLLYFPHGFISDYATIYKRYDLLSVCK